MKNLQRLHDWLCNSALPLWATRGFTPGRNRFAEKLLMDGSPDATAAHRLMVQARQVSVYCVAEKRGWMPGAGDIAREAANTMITSYHRQGSKGGWAFAIGNDGQIEPSIDLYAHAFALFALAHLHSLTEDARWLAIARDTQDWMDRYLALEAGGYAEKVPTPNIRHQNPHMHLLEAYSELASTSHEEYWRDRAAIMRQLGLDRIVNMDTGALPELFSSDWTKPDASAWIEPGHQYEWMWLLDQSCTLAGGDMRKAVHALHHSASTKGIDAGGYVVNALSLSGETTDDARRLWPQTEALRAECILAGQGDEQARNRADTHAACLLAGFIDPAPDGCWIDRIAADGTPLSTDVPASSLYHLMGAVVAAENTLR